MTPPDQTIPNATHQLQTNIKLLYILDSDLRYMDCVNAHYEICSAINDIIESNVLSTQLIKGLELFY